MIVEIFNRINMLNKAFQKLAAKKTMEAAKDAANNAKMLMRQSKTGRAYKRG